jgi:hypothetical protein
VYRFSVRPVYRFSVDNSTTQYLAGLRGVPFQRG